MMTTYSHPLQNETANRPLHLLAVATAVPGVLAVALEVLVEARRARAAEELHQRLSAMSEEVLARAGLDRTDIPTEVRRRLYDPPNRTGRIASSPKLPRSSAPVACERYRASAIVSGVALSVLVAVGTAAAEYTIRVRGTIERVDDGPVYVVKVRGGDTVRLSLAPNANVAASVKSALSDIKPGAFIGVAALPQVDGALRALEAHILHESMRGTGEGHRPWDLLPKSTMTNATVQDIVQAVDGHSVTLKYPGGEQRIVVPADTVVVTYLPGTTAELKAGAVIFVPAANRQADGTLQAARIMVGRDIAPPQ